MHGFKNGQNLEYIPQKKEVSGNIKVRLISEKPTLCFNNATFFELHKLP